MRVGEGRVCRIKGRLGDKFGLFHETVLSGLPFRIILKDTIESGIFISMFSGIVVLLK